MTSDTLNTLKAILELGWPAIITLMFAYLALRYLADRADQIAYLRKRVDDLETRLDKMDADNALLH